MSRAATRAKGKSCDGFKSGAVPALTCGQMVRFLRSVPFLSLPFPCRSSPCTHLQPVPRSPQSTTCAKRQWPVCKTDTSLAPGHAQRRRRRGHAQRRHDSRKTAAWITSRKSVAWTTLRKPAAWILPQVSNMDLAYTYCSLAVVSLVKPHPG